MPMKSPVVLSGSAGIGYGTSITNCANFVQLQPFLSASAQLLHCCYEQIVSPSLALTLDAVPQQNTVHRRFLGPAVVCVRSAAFHRIAIHGFFASGFW